VASILLVLAHSVEIGTISTQMLWRLASAIKPGRPVNIDRVFGASYNTRSALEALILHTPDYYSCFPGRLEKMGPVTTVKKGHKHIIFCPGEPHTSGVIVKKVIEDMVISEVDREVYFDSLMLTDSTNKKAIDVEIDRRHAQIQVLLIKCAEAMGLKTWVAKNDQGIKYKDQRLIEFESVMKDLASSPALQGYPNAGPAGELIDCIWFSDDGKKIPAIIEIEHSTGVTSGLNRMKGFMEEAPELAHMTYIIAAPDEIRAEVMRKACAPQFDDMNIQYLPYSAVEDLYLLCNRKLKGIDSAKFFHTFLEPVQKKS
jgi:type II restriction enzyme